MFAGQITFPVSLRAGFPPLNRKSESASRPCLRFKSRCECGLIEQGFSEGGGSGSAVDLPEYFGNVRFGGWTDCCAAI